MPTEQTFDTIDVLKLEIARRPGGIRNGVPNPRGELGTWGWLTPLAGSDLNSANGQRNLFSTAGEFLLSAFNVGGVPPTEVLAVSSPTPAVVGRYYAARANLLAGSASDSNVSLQVRFLDAAGATLAATAWTSPTRNTTQFVSATVAPAGTVTHALAVRAHKGAAVLAPGAWSSFTQAMTADGATATAADNAVATFVDAWEWVDVLSPTTNIDVARGTLQPGTLQATIYDATLDPALANSLVRPGSPVRLLAQRADTSFAPIYTGTIVAPTTDYDPVQIDDDHKVRITLSATDNLAKVANTPSPNGVGQVAHLSAFFEGSLVPWNLNNDPNGEGVTPPVVSRNARATLLDQIIITRDTRRAWAYVDAYGTMTVIDPATLPAPSVIARALTEADFNNPTINFDPSACVNYLTVKALQAPVDATSDSEALVFGPYDNPDSRDRWGTYYSEATVHGLTAAEVATYAAALLASNSTPTRRITGLTLPMWTASDVHNKAHLELTERVTVDSTAANLSTVHARIRGIRHTITPDKWLITHDYADPNGTPLPAATTAPISVVTSATAVDTPWADVTFAGAWVNFDTTRKVQYRRFNGEVQLRGICKSGAVGSGVSMFTLPAGFRPEVRAGTAEHHFPVVANDAAQAAQVWASGAVCLLAGSNAYVDVSNIRFQAVN